MPALHQPAVQRQQQAPLPCGGLGQLLQLRQHPLAGHHTQLAGMALNPALAGGLQAEIEAVGQADAPKQPQGVGQQIGLAHGHQLAARQVGEATGGIHQWGWAACAGGQGQGHGIDGVIPAPQIGLQVGAVPLGQVDVPALHHEPGDAVVRIEHHGAAAVVPGQVAGQGDGIALHHEVEVGLGRKAAQQRIPDRAAHQGCARWKRRQRQRPGLGQ